jgi:hypothetical protein
MYIGKLIEAEFNKQNRSVTWLARKLFCERTNVYSIFRRESIDTDLLMKLSVILEHDFFVDFHNEFEDVIKNQHNSE